MGMDVLGKAPKSEAGVLLQTSVWTWRPLVSLLENLYPDLTKKIKYLQSDGGDGLDDDDAQTLGRRMAQHLSDGTIEAWISERNAAVAGLLDETCQWCTGTGTRTDEIGVSLGMAEKGWCNACDGKGARRPLATSYGLDYETVVIFAEFVAESGGFEIW